MVTDVTIGIPVLNEAQNIAALIHSVMSDQLFQTAHVHVAVYDDGSTDETPQILERLVNIYQGKLQIWSSDRCEGKSAGLNLLASIAREEGSEFLCFLDGDIELGESSLFKMIERLRPCPPNRIVVPLVRTRTNGLRFPLRDIYEFKARTELYRMTYRPYINGRAFAMRTFDFPTLPSRLKQCDDRYLTMLFTPRNVVPCLNAEIRYTPPQTISDFVKDRIKDQHRLIWLAKYQNNLYKRLKNKRFSLFHTYIGSYPEPVRAEIKKTLLRRTAIALIIERFLLVFARILGEITFLVRGSTEAGE